MCSLQACRQAVFWNRTVGTALQEAPGPAALRRRIHPLAPYAVENAPAGACRAFFSRPGLSTSLSRAIARRTHGFYVAGPLEYANLRVPSADCHFTVEEVPSHLPQTWCEAYFMDFADHVPGGRRLHCAPRQIGEADLWPRFEEATEEIDRHLDNLLQGTNCTTADADCPTGRCYTPIGPTSVPGYRRPTVSLPTTESRSAP